jgi:amino acid adenylation domain-containing protein
MNLTIANPAPLGLLVQDFLEQAAHRLPEKVALICGERRLTYREIEAQANRLAHALIEIGVRRGDRVALYLHNSVEAVVGIFAALKVGAAFVAINPATKRDKLHAILNNCRPVALIAEARADLSGLLDQGTSDLPSLQGLILCGRAAGPVARSGSGRLTFEAVQECNPATPVPRCNLDLDLACLIYTSGTTGEPKGVMCGHDNVVFATTAIVSYLRNTEADVVLSVLPLSFTYGLYQLLAMFRVGGTLVLEGSFTYPAVVIERMQRERVTGFPGVPTIYSVLLRMDLAACNLSSLRYLTNAAAALPEQHILELRKRLPQVEFFSMYGQTETARTLYLPAEWVDRKPASVGLPIPGSEAWVVDEHGQQLPSGPVGELVVRGRHVMRGYWEAPEAAAQRFRPGPLPGERLCYTGDLFRTDSDGCFYFVSRKDDIIKCRGEKVAPKEVEGVLLDLPGVREVAVIGVPDAILGQAIKAFVVASNGELTAKQILAHCRARLEEFMVPKFVEFCAELPRTDSGKIKKSELS